MIMKTVSFHYNIDSMYYESLKGCVNFEIKRPPSKWLHIKNNSDNWNKFKVLYNKQHHSQTLQVVEHIVD